MIWDDHEVDNNYAGLIGENDMESDEQMRTRRAAAYQAWWEHQPVRVPRAKSWADLTIMRTSTGARSRASICSTDDSIAAIRRAATERSEVPCGDWADPKRTMLGDDAGEVAERRSREVEARIGRSSPIR